MELFKLFGTIAIDNQSANNAINETTETAEKSHPRISSAFEKIGSAAVKVGTVMATGLAAGATAIGALAKKSLDSYADYEQLVGGVETLFKDSATTIQDYADRAYETAGLSANEYMETVTSFSASLLQGLNGDTAKAAEIADRAITDMSDNANKMGTSMSMIQNAYQGFAKQNYTMLDNLKLGYGGTQSEMARLINDSGVLGDSIEVTAETVNSVSFDKIIEAISVVQDRMGITGTTAKEASATISGSITSMKAQWQNLMTAFAGDGWDLGVYVSNFAETVKIAAGNIVPRIAQILSGISEALPQVFAVISAELPGLMEALLPGLMDGAVTLVFGLAQMLPSLVQILFSELPYLISDALYNSTSPALSSLGSLFLDIGEFWREVLLPAISGVGEALGTLWGAVQPILAVFPALFTETTGITNGFDIFRQICWAVEDALQFVADKITAVASWISEHSAQIQNVIHGLWSGVQTVWNTIGQPIFDIIQTAVEMVSVRFQVMMPLITRFVQQCFTDIQNFWNNNLKPCFDAIGNFIQNVLAPIFEAVFAETILPAIKIAFLGIKDLWNNTLKPVFTGITDFLTGVFTLNFEQAWKGLKSIVTGAVNGIINGIETMINGAINALNGLIEGINKAISLAGSLLGLDISIPTIPLLKLPRLEEGGILEKGQVGLLEGNGAEAVVPLDQNKAWISAVARDMQGALGGKDVAVYLQNLIDMLADYFPQVIAAAGHDIVTNDGVIVARYAPMMNAELGKISARKDRGR